MLEKKTNIYWLFILPGCIFLTFLILIPLCSRLFKSCVDEGGSLSLVNYFTVL